MYIDESYRLGVIIFVVFLVFIAIALAVVFISRRLSSKKREGFAVVPPTGALNTDNISTIQSVLPVDQLDSMFARIEEMKKEVRTRVSQALPKGLICMWSGMQGATPNGWQLCDGTNGSPDLRGRFIVAADPAGDLPMDITGGQSPDDYHKNGPEATIKPNNLPEHTHPIAGFNKFKGPGTKSFWDFGKDGGVYRLGEFERITSSDRVQPNRGPTMNDPTEENETSNRPISLPKPPYYSLAYIMYLGLNA